MTEPKTGGNFVLILGVVGMVGFLACINCLQVSQIKQLQKELESQKVQAHTLHFDNLKLSRQCGEQK